MIDAELVRRDPYQFNLNFALSLDDGYKNVIVSKSEDPGESEVTPKEQDLIHSIKYLDHYMEYRESVHGKVASSDTVTIDSLKCLGRISMPPVNTLSNSTNLTYHSFDNS